MKRSHLLFIATALAQLGVLAWAIIGQERILRQGEVFLFRTAPLDPRDPFRGEYVRLDFEAESGRWVVADSIITTPRRYYARLGTDSAGFARITHLRTTPPPAGPYLAVRPGYDDGTAIIQVELPFDRYYLKEGEGARTEALLMPQWADSVRSAPLPAHAVVRVHEGRAVVEDLVVGGRPLRAWLE